MYSHKNTVPHRLPRGGATVVAALSATVLFSGCATTGGSAPSEGDPNEMTHTIAVQGIENIDPARVAAAEANQLLKYMYDLLVWKDPESGDIVSGLASDWDIRPDSAHFVIRDDVTCSDGSVLTAATVARNFERYQDPEAPAPGLSAYLNGPGFEVSHDDDANTVDIKFGEPVAFLADQFSLWPPIVCDAGLEDPDTLQSESTGSGPYVLEESTPGVSWTLKKRDGYAWGPDGQTGEDMPGTVVFKAASDPNAIVNLLLTDGADTALLSGDALARARDTLDLVEAAPTDITTTMLYNQRDGMATADPAVRRALAQALDTAEYTGGAGSGAEEPATSVNGPASLCSAQGEIDDALVTGAGKDAATKTLEDSGWIAGADGVREKDGQRLVVRLVEYGTAPAGSELVRQTWTDIGADVTVDNRPPSEAVGVLMAGTEWEAAFLSYGAQRPVQNLFSGPASPGGFNFGDIQNEMFVHLTAEGTEDPDSCDAWIEAERALVSTADVAPLMVGDAAWVSTDWNVDGAAAYLQPTRTTLR